jgi:nicotinate-nucleotide adenylyltransferase
MAGTIALFGGSFDPPHLAHQMACLYALACEPVDQVWLLPTYRHAFGKPLAPFDDRVAMCERAAAPLSGGVVVSRVEEEVARARGAESRTFHTLVHLGAAHPDLAFRLLIGEDILAETASWHRWDDVVRLAPPIVVGRGGAEQAAGPVVRLPPISSTDVRQRLRRGDPVAPLVPRAVLDYIAGRGLYR